MVKLILTRGVPASGKSTWAKAWVAEDPKNRLRVNRDNIRWTLGIKGGVGDYEQEKEVTYWEQAMVRRGLQQGKDVVIDATNLRAKYVKEWLWMASDENVEVEFKDFEVTLDQAIYFDAVRGMKGGRSVGADVIEERFFKPFVDKRGKLPPVPSIEGLALPTGNFKKYQHRDGLRYALIVDIDGTLAHMNGRSPYDATRYHEDTFDEVVAAVVRAWKHANPDGHVLVMSGRNEEDGKTPTIKWLWASDFEYDALYMRKAGDNRNDAIVKNELFEEYIAGRYNIDFVLDDRNQVVKMWRAKGLRVFQVADGDF